MDLTQWCSCGHFKEKFYSMIVLVPDWNSGRYWNWKLKFGNFKQKSGWEFWTLNMVSIWIQANSEPLLICSKKMCDSRRPKTLLCF